MVEAGHVVLGTDGSGAPVTLTPGQATRHVLACGSTGSGKTSLLLSMAFGAMANGGGCMYVDGKGDRDALSGFAAAAEATGRQDDLLVVDLGTHEHRRRRTHTYNPFATQPLRTLCEVTTGTMRVDEARTVWGLRVDALVDAVLRALVFLRDRGLIDLSAGEVRDHVNLRRVIDLADADKYPEMPVAIRKALGAYLSSLPGFQREKGYRQSQTTLDQHGFLEMQLTRALGYLADQVGHVTGDPHPDVDVRDVHDNGRLLFVSLPLAGLQRSENLMAGSLAMSMLNGMLAHVADRPSPRDPGAAPFMVLLDEFGRYTLPGSEGIVAQARSLGVSLTFATHSLLPTENDPQGTLLDHVLANTGTKVLLRSDLVDETRLSRIAPTASALDASIQDLRARMAHICDPGRGWTVTRTGTAGGGATGSPPTDPSSSGTTRPWSGGTGRTSPASFPRSGPGRWSSCGRAR